MAKEIIYDTVDCFDVIVSWDRDRGVQIGVEMKPPRTSDAPQNLKELTATWSDDEAQSYMGIWHTASREGINRLIRSLRKARDQAFGADA